jgi:hypothetical protein
LCLELLEDKSPIGNRTQRRVVDAFEDGCVSNVCQAAVSGPKNRNRRGVTVFGVGTNEDFGQSRLFGCGVGCIKLLQVFSFVDLLVRCDPDTYDGKREGRQHPGEQACGVDKRVSRVEKDDACCVLSMKGEHSLGQGLCTCLLRWYREDFVREC